MRHFQSEWEVQRHLVLRSVMKLLCGGCKAKKGSVAVAFCLRAVVDVSLRFVCTSTEVGGGEIVVMRCFLFCLYACRCRCCCCSNKPQWTFSVEAFNSFSVLEFKFLLGKLIWEMKSGCAKMSQFVEWFFVAIEKVTLIIFKKSFAGQIPRLDNVRRLACN